MNSMNSAPAEVSITYSTENTNKTQSPEPGHIFQVCCLRLHLHNMFLLLGPRWMDFGRLKMNPYAFLLM